MLGEEAEEPTKRQSWRLQVRIQGQKGASYNEKEYKRIKKI